MHKIYTAEVKWPLSHPPNSTDVRWKCLFLSKFPDGNINPETKFWELLLQVEPAFKPCKPVTRLASLLNNPSALHADEIPKHPGKAFQLLQRTANQNLAGKPSCVGTEFHHYLHTAHRIIHPNFKFSHQECFPFLQLSTGVSHWWVTLPSLPAPPLKFPPRILQPYPGTKVTWPLLGHFSFCSTPKALLQLPGCCFLAGLPNLKSAKAQRK